MRRRRFGVSLMSTKMTNGDWEVALWGFPALPSEAGCEGEGRPSVSGGAALLCGSQHHLAGAAGAVRALEYGMAAFSPSEPFRVFEDFFATLADLSSTAHLVQMFDSTVTRAHVSAAGAKGGSRVRRLDARGAVSAPKST